MQRGNRIHPHLGWALTLPLRLLRPLDGPLTRLTPAVPLDRPRGRSRVTAEPATRPGSPGAGAATAGARARARRIVTYVFSGLTMVAYLFSGVISARALGPTAAASRPRSPR